MASTMIKTRRVAGRDGVATVNLWRTSPVDSPEDERFQLVLTYEQLGEATAESQPMGDAFDVRELAERAWWLLVGTLEALSHNDSEMSAV